MNERSGFGIRLGAMILDGVLVSVGGFLVGGTIGGMLGGLVGGAGGSTMLQLEEFANNPEAQAAAGAMAGGMAGGMIGWVLGVVLFTLIYMLIEAFTGASPGKMMVGIKIGTTAGTEAPISQLLTRYALKNSATLLALVAAITGLAVLSTVGSLAGFAVFIGCFFVLGQNKQALHDIIAKTAVYPRAALKKIEPTATHSEALPG